MKKTLWTAIATLTTALNGWAAASVTVNQSGSGNFTNIQAAIDSGATTITITDSGQYLENLQIPAGPAVTLTSNKNGTNRPVITPVNTTFYSNARRGNQGAGVGILANHTVVSNLIIEAQPDLAVGAMVVIANNVRIENCLFRIATNTLNTLSATASPLLFLGQQGDPNTPTPGGPNSDGFVARNCEFIGVAADANPLEPTGTGEGFDGSAGYLGEKASGRGTGQGSGYVRMDIYTMAGEDVFVTFEGCWFHHCRDYGIFPTNVGFNPGTLNLVVKKCRFDANGKFFVRGRGANVQVQDSVLTRAAQLRSSDTENSAIAIQQNDGHTPSGSVSNCVFVNCGSANYQQGYFGGVNNNNGNFIGVTNCTFVACLTGVDSANGGSGSLAVSKSIFHQIGDNVPPAVDYGGVMITNGSPDLIGGLYPAWTNGLINFINKYSAVFNRFNWNNGGQILIDTCLVGSIDTEDTRPWDEARTNGVTGCRLFAGYDTNFVGAGTVTRGAPVFSNTDPDAPNAFQLAGGSPGQGLGANLAPVLSPRLTISRVGSQVNISWTALPIWVKGSLKSAPSLSSPTWTPVAGVSNNAVTVSIDAANKYFAIVQD